MTEPHTDESLRVEIARLAGKLETIIAQMQAGDRQAEQLVTLVKDQLAFHAADLGELKAVVREASIRTENAINVVRQDLEKRIEREVATLNERFEHHTTRLNSHSQDLQGLKLWRAKIGGIAAASAVLGSVVSAAVTKLLGG